MLRVCFEQAAGGAFGILFRGGAGGAVDSVIPSLLAGLAGPQPGQALAGLRVILGVRPSALNSMLPKLLKPPLTKADVTALGALSQVAGSLPPHSIAFVPPSGRDYPARNTYVPCPNTYSVSKYILPMSHVYCIWLFVCTRFASWACTLKYNLSLAKVVFLDMAYFPSTSNLSCNQHEFPTCAIVCTPVYPAMVLQPWL